MWKLRFNPDPKLQRVCLIAFLLMVQLILFKLVEILATGRQPTEIEVELLGCEGLTLLVTYILTFLQKEEAQTSPS